MINRNKIEIIAVVLKAASSNGGALKARITYEGYLSWAQLKEYLALVVKNGLIKYQERDRTFIITEKGKHYLNIHNELNKDRKSTRLNSSHMSISYAAFC